MQVTGRFSPHPRGFGFVEPAPTDPTAGRPDSAFVPPDLGRGWLADDQVVATVEVDDKQRLTATELVLESRTRRFAVGRVATFAGQVVLELDRKLGAGTIDLDPSVASQVQRNMGWQIVVMLGQGEDGRPTGDALVVKPEPASSPMALRARAIVIAHGGAAPNSIPGGPTAVGLAPVEAMATALRATGRMAGGGTGLAAGLDVLHGEVPGVELPIVDHRDEVCVTIDADTTRDLDDAVSAGWSGEPDDVVHLVVHITDAAGTIGMGTDADRYAATMATSAYFVAGDNAPMLDPVLSEAELSLVAHQPRRVISVRMEIAPDGTPSDPKLEVSWIQPTARLSYAAVDAWLNDGDDRHLAERAHGPYGAPATVASYVGDALRGLSEASRRLGVDRDGRDTLEALFEPAVLEPAVIDGRIRTRDADPHPAAQKLIERCMVAANEAVAGWAADHDVPLLYRSHLGFDPARMDRLNAAVAGIGKELVPAEGHVTVEPGDLLALVAALRAEDRHEDAAAIATVATSAVARATYDPDPAHHKGLGSGRYTHFTSPLRRYADLVVHRQIRAAMAGETPPYTVERLTALAPWLDARAGAASYAETLERGALWAVLLERGAIDWPAVAVVSGLSPAGMRVRLLEPGVSGFITAARALQLSPKDRPALSLDDHELSTVDGAFKVGMRIKVKLDRIDITGRPEFTPLG